MKLNLHQNYSALTSPQNREIRWLSKGIRVTSPLELSKTQQMELFTLTYVVRLIDDFGNYSQLPQLKLRPHPNSTCINGLLP